MKATTIKWHLARDDQRSLAKFCDEHQIDREVSDYYEHDGVEGKFFTHTTRFDNGGFITAEMKQGDSIANNYQVVDYSLGK